MTDIEQLISRYLDRELSPKEEEMFARILSESPAAREQLNEMQAIRSAARRLPTLTVPSAQVESRLFQQLFVEESSEEEDNRRRAIPLLLRVSDGIRRRGAVLATALLLIALMGGGGLWFAAENSGTNSPVVADASRPFTLNEGNASALPSAVQPYELAAQTESSLSKTDPSEGDRRNSTLSERESVESNRVGDRGMNETTVRRSESPNEVEPDGSVPYASNDAFGRGSISNGEEGSWPPSNLLARNPMHDDSPEPVNESTASLSEERAPLLYAVERPATSEDQTISASYRHGLAYLQNEQNEFTSQDISLRIEGRFEDRHRLSLSVGQSPILIERTTRTMPTGIAVPDPEKGTSTASAERIEHFSEIGDEVWAGIGYGYAVVSSDRVRIEPGLNVGVGERSLRFSAELPIRYRLSDRFSLDVVGSISRVQPHDQISRDVDREYDPSSFLHVDAEQHPVFTSLGASIGLSFDIGR